MLENLPRPEVELVGSDGNAFSILAKMDRAFRKAGWKSDQIDLFMKEAMDGDYDHLLQICMKYADIS